MQQYIDKLNRTFNKILIDNKNLQLWEKFRIIMNEIYDEEITLLYVYDWTFKIKDNAEIMSIKKEIKKLDEEKVKAIKAQSFDYAMILSERSYEREMFLDRACAKVHFKTDNYFYSLGIYKGIGFNFTGNKVIDFLMKHYSLNRDKFTFLRKT